ncbi:class A beta-lactamase-related serine hydrolase [Actinomadura spongiicola]|uniref:Class A beta-lactamase-related serine hydrolase n=1 Tax=Actinomadura spongiicola TaxID=2303421 RepID=A0A372GGN4_9ACTN|nr:serine hydrolase domain-containing protein [Actinomadura spongiicola]RFS84544.1 class A beta-lactamase-related serine hydrolase [Actinomadura spongiicola]
MAKRFDLRGRLADIAAAWGAAVVVTLALTVTPAHAAATAQGNPAQGYAGQGNVGQGNAGPAAPAGVALARPPTGPFDPAKLRATLDAAHDAGMYGTWSAAQDGRTAWNGASGVADVQTRRPVKPDMRQRVGSITKTFVATAILQQVEKGRLELDAPVGRYLPDVFPGRHGKQVTVRMLLNHTSGLGDYLLLAFPSLSDLSPESLDENRFRRLTPEQLITWGMQAPRTGEPGERYSYSNTNYVIAGRLLEKVTGTTAERYIDRNVIGKAGLKHTYFPSRARVSGPHSRLYESLYQHVEPPRDYSTYDVSWAWTAGALVSTMDDLNRFYRRLLTGELIGEDALAQMRRTVPVKDADGNVLKNYGLGLYSTELPCGTFWGHDGTVFGSGTQSLSSAGGARQISLTTNLARYSKLDSNGVPVPHPIDSALGAHVVEALCGSRPVTESPGRERPVRVLPLQVLRLLG